MKKNIELKKLELLCDYTTNVQNQMLAYTATDTILGIVRQNCFHALMIDDISQNIQEWLKDLSMPKLEYLIENDILSKVYRKIEKRDGYDNMTICELTDETIKEYLDNFKKLKRK